MKLTPAQRNEIFREVRAILVRYWIDLGFISIHVSEQTIYIRGSLKRLAGVPEQLSGAVVEAMFAEIKGLRGINHVQAQFDNWSGSVSAGGWNPRDAVAVSNWERMRMASAGKPSTFEAEEVSDPQS
ncbi:MAG TPA: hypothetical protein PLT67_10090 [Kiritimatiellia bacterium]|nr:hypothetical protein [Kiritimatiellia bacterium]HQQ05170.1 hypothetical protein [Kiritimatiellia bacterium]